MKNIGVKDSQKVTSKGELLDKLIDGVVVRRAITHVDERGSLCEVASENWDTMNFPSPHIYVATIRPQKVKGWSAHHEQYDRLFVISGSAKIALFDDRIGSPTNGMANEIFISNENRSSVLIPPYVWHLVENIGTEDLIIINSADKAYNYESPDKYSLPANYNHKVGRAS